MSGLRAGMRPGSALARWLAAVLCLVLLAGPLHVHNAHASAQGHGFDAHLHSTDGASDTGTPDAAHGIGAPCPSALGCSFHALVAEAAVPMPHLGSLTAPEPATAPRGVDLLPRFRPPKPSVQA